MKNSFVGVLSLTLGMVFMTGCSLNPLADAPQDGEAAATASPMTSASTKVKECDEVIAFIEKGLQNPEEGYFERAARELVLNTAKSQILKMVEEQTDLSALASTCTEIRKGLEGQTAEAQN